MYRSERAEQKKHTVAFDKMVAKSTGSLDVIREFFKDDKQWGRLVSLVRISIRIRLWLIPASFARLLVVRDRMTPRGSNTSWTTSSLIPRSPSFPKYLILLQNPIARSTIQCCVML
jgi:hypothetical protein